MTILRQRFLIMSCMENANGSPELTDLSKETAATKSIYGIDEKHTDDFANNVYSLEEWSKEESGLSV